MNNKKAYKQKMEAEMELAQAQLAELKAEAKSFAADAQIKFANQIDELEQKVEATKGKIKEMAANPEAWEQLKEGVEGALAAIRRAVQDTVAKIKG